jgi:hypothetical protein
MGGQVGRYLLFIYYTFIFKIVGFFFLVIHFLSHLNSKEKPLVKLDVFKLIGLI